MSGNFSWYGSFGILFSLGLSMDIPNPNIYLNIGKTKKTESWKLIFDRGKKYISSCFSCGSPIWRVRDRSQESHLQASLTAENETRLKPWQMQREKHNLAAERVVWTPSNLKSPVWKYFRFWSVDGKNTEPQDKVVCKLCKLQLAYHSTTSNMRAHLENVHPNDIWYFSPPATSSLSAARQEVC